MMPVFRWVWQARLVRIIDADSLVFVIDRGFFTEQTERIRLLGVDAPELIGVSAMEGRAAMRFVAEWTAEGERNTDADWPFLLETHRPRERDSFGRWLADVWRVSDGHRLSAALLATGHAAPWAR